MSQALVRSTLMTALANYANTHNPPLSLARENQAFVKPTTGATFLEAFVIPANTVIPNVAADRRRLLGSFQINIWTKQGSGSQSAETIAEELSQLFKVFPKTLLPVSIESPASIKTSIEDSSSWWVTPVSFSYRLEADN